ncbi:helix-turn-helix domain-containing protein [Pantoea cypripedii]|uniref:helix-turn-helix domain-containing protein n=1 Tax=Pantoea cypripedii TaxID=55209 RepID=UPI002FC856F1
MYEDTHSVAVPDHASAITSIVQRYYPQAQVNVSHSAKRYDDALKDTDENVDERNESYILSHQILSREIIIEAVCLYIDSLKINIKNIDNNPENGYVHALINDIKVYFLSGVIKYQNLMFRKVSDNTWHLASGLSHEVILQHVIEGVLNTIPHSDAAIFRIYDQEKNLLIPVAMLGFENNYYEYSVTPQQSIAGKVFESRTSILVNSREEILNSFTEHSIVRETIMKNNPIANALLCVPVLDQQTCYGTLTILSLKRHSVFNSLAISLLETFASQVALAWRNARLYDEKAASLREVETLKTQLEKQNRLLKVSVDLHADMINLSTKFNRLDEFIEQLSARVNSAMSYIDILGHRYFKASNQHYSWDTLSHLHKAHDNTSNVITEGECLIYPLINDDFLVGFIIINGYDIDELNAVIAARIRDFVVMEIMKRTSAVIIAHKKIAFIFQEIIRYGLSARHERSLLDNGFHFKNWIMCIRLSPFNTELNDLTFITIKNHLVGKTGLNHSAFYVENDEVVIFHAESMNGKLSVLEQKIAEDHYLQHNFQVGLSPITTKENIVISHQQAGTALDVLKTRQRPGILNFSNTGIERLFTKHNSEELKTFVNDVLSPVLDTGDKGAVLIATLQSYLKNSQSTVLAAKELNIHINTLYQRLRKFETLTHLSLTNPDDFLMISLSCHMNRIYS